MAKLKAAVCIAGILLISLTIIGIGLTARFSQYDIGGSISLENSFPTGATNIVDRGNGWWEFTHGSREFLIHRRELRGVDAVTELFDYSKLPKSRNDRNNRVDVDD